MSTIQELGTFLTREQAAAGTTPPPAPAALDQGANGPPTTGRDEPSREVRSDRR
jgi:hypothetical protein